MRTGIEFERRVLDQMRLDLFHVESSYWLDHRKIDYLFSKNNGKILPFPVDGQFTIRYDDLEKLLKFIERQPFHPHRKRLYIRVVNQKGRPVDEVTLKRIAPIAQAIEETVMAIQQRKEGIFILSIDEKNEAELLSLQELVQQLKATKLLKASNREAPPSQTAPPRLTTPPALPLGVIGRIELGPNRTDPKHPERRGWIRGRIIAIGSKGVTIVDESGVKYRAWYEDFSDKKAKDLANNMKNHCLRGGTIDHYKEKTRKVYFKSIIKDGKPNYAKNVKRD